MRDGEVVARPATRRSPASLRSAAKPLQALPLAARLSRALGEDELAIAAASHFGTARARRGRCGSCWPRPADSEDELDCGIQDGRPPEPDLPQLLRQARRDDRDLPRQRLAGRGLPPPGPSAAASPARGGRGCGRARAGRDLDRASDGCGVVAFALPLERGARSPSPRLESLDGGDRIAAAMRAHPELIGGEGATDTALMQAQPGTARQGRRRTGCICAAGRPGPALALKVADGNSRALTARRLRRSALEPRPPLPEFDQVPLRNRARRSGRARFRFCKKIVSNCVDSCVTSRSATEGEPGDGETGSWSFLGRS